jgi:hypothetical protein
VGQLGVAAAQRAVGRVQRGHAGQRAIGRGQRQRGGAVAGVARRIGARGERRQRRDRRRAPDHWVSSISAASEAAMYSRLFAESRTMK